jgi:hypothetical protein
MVFCVLGFARVSNAGESSLLSRQKVVTLVSLGNCCEDTAWPKAERRIWRELQSSGIQVVPFNDPGDDRLKKVLEQVVVADRSDGAVALHLSKDGEVLLSMVFIHPKTGRKEFRTVSLGTAPSDKTIEITAIKAQEAVLAALYEEEGRPPERPRDEGNERPIDEGNERTVPPASKPKSAPVALPSATSRQPNDKKPEVKRKSRTDDTPRKHRFGLHADFSLEWSQGGAFPMGAAGGGVSWYLPKHLVIGASASVTVLKKDITRDNASASVQLMLGRIHLAFVFKKLGPIRPVVGARVGAGYFGTTGNSETITDVTTERAALFYAGGFAELSIALGSRVFIPIHFDIGALPPGVTVRFSGEPVAAVNVLLLEAGIGMEVVL